MKAESVGRTSWDERIKILDVVIGSNHFLIHPQTVGKKAGAPMIYYSFSSTFRSMKLLCESWRLVATTYKYPI